MASGASVEHDVLNFELASRLDHAVRQLSEPVRAAFALRGIHGLSTTEVATVLEVSESAVKMRLARGQRGAACATEGVPVMRLSCSDLDAMLPEFLDGSVTAEEEALAAEHLATCQACSLELNELQGVTKLYREHGMLKLPDEARKRIADALGLPR